MASARKIIIIGATSGIGYEITQLYRKQGWRIGIAGRRTELLAKIRSEAPDQIETAQIDVTCPDAPEKLAELIDRVGGMDVFLLSSGIGSQNRNLNSDIVYRPNKYSRFHPNGHFRIRLLQKTW